MKENNKKIQLKNYIVVSIVFILVILLTLIIGNWYRNYKKYQLTIPVISGQVKEIKDNEFENYIMEHDNFILYIGTSENSNCRDLEKKLVPVLKNKNLLDEIIYLNISDIKNKKAYLNELYRKYGMKDGSIGYPSIIIVKNSKFFDYKTRTKTQNLTISTVKNLLEQYEAYND